MLTFGIMHGDIGSFPHSLASFDLPLSTNLIGLPDGGDLYFIDFLGALVGTPICMGVWARSGLQRNHAVAGRFGGFGGTIFGRNRSGSRCPLYGHGIRSGLSPFSSV